MKDERLAIPVMAFYFVLAALFYAGARLIHRKRGFGLAGYFYIAALGMMCDAGIMLSHVFLGTP